MGSKPKRPDAPPPPPPPPAPPTPVARKPITKAVVPTTTVNPTAKQRKKTTSPIYQKQEERKTLGSGI